MITRPETDEFASLYAPHVRRIPQGADIFEILSHQGDELRTLLQSVSDEQASIRPAEGEWSIKEVVGHVLDIDRIYSNRILCCARGEISPLMTFNTNAFVDEANFNSYTLKDLIGAFDAYRRADMLYYKQLSSADIERQGSMLDHPVTVRALLYIMAGHVMHHIESLKTTYRVEEL